MEWNCLVHRPTINSRPLRQQSAKRLNLAPMVWFKGLKGTETIGRFSGPRMNRRRTRVTPYWTTPKMLAGLPRLTRLTALTAAAAGGALSGQALFLSLGAEEAPVFEFPKNPGVLYRGAKTVNQTFRAFSVPRCYKSHSVLLYICGLDLPPRPLPSLLKSRPTSLPISASWLGLA